MSGHIHIMPMYISASPPLSLSKSIETNKQTIKGNTNTPPLFLRGVEGARVERERELEGVG